MAVDISHPICMVNWWYFTFILIPEMIFYNGGRYLPSNLHGKLVVFDIHFDPEMIFNNGGRYIPPNLHGELMII
jgi:hypothetical protein